MTADPHGFGDLTLDAFTRLLASAEPVPGGGSACAIAASLAASLVAMVARLSADRPRYAEHAPTHARALKEADALRERLLALADADAAAYAAFGAARRLPRETPADQLARDAAVRAAARHAADVPMDIVRACGGILDAADALVGRSNVNASSDLDVAALLAEAAARGAAANVIINLPSVGDAQRSAEMGTEVETRLARIAAAAARIHDDIRSGVSRPPLPG